MLKSWLHEFFILWERISVISSLCCGHFLKGLFRFGLLFCRFEFKRESDAASNEKQQMSVDDFTEIVQNTTKWILKDVFLTEIVEMPDTITNPCHKCPFYVPSEDQIKQQNEASQSLLAGLIKENSSKSKWKVKWLLLRTQKWPKLI